MAEAGAAGAERAGPQRDVPALAGAAAADPGDQVEGAADTGAAELDRHAAAVQLDVAEAVELEARQIHGGGAEPRQRHAVDQDLGVARRGAAHRHRREAAQPAQRAALGADRGAHRLGEAAGLAGALVDVHDGDERRAGQGLAAVAGLGVVAGQVTQAAARRPIVDDDDLVRRLGRGRANARAREHAQ